MATFETTALICFFMFLVGVFIYSIINQKHKEELWNAQYEARKRQIYLDAITEEEAARAKAWK